MAKKIIVTGANRGIGYEVCRQLTEKGNEVILTGRDASKVESAANGLNCRHHPLDVTDRESILNFAKFVESEGPFDVLINNAGKAIDNVNDILQLEDGRMEKMMATNAFGPFYLTRALHSFISAGGQVVMVSSGAGEMCGGFSSYSPTYSASKTLLNSFTRHFSIALQSKPVYVNAMGPGWVNTDMGGPDAPRSVEQGAETIVWLAEGGAGEATGKFFRDKQEVGW